MALRVVGAGLARTGTASLKLALEELLGAPSYHMFEVFANPQHIPVWHEAVHGKTPDWGEFFAGYSAAVDLPVSAYWQELAEVNPGAVIILSVRDSAEKWWESVSQTLFSPSRPEPEPGTPMAKFRAMAMDMWRVRLGVRDVSDKQALMSAYVRHNEAVRAEAPPDRLIEWRASDGWEPLAKALGVPAPEAPFPHVNSRDEFATPEIGTRRQWSGEQ